MQIVLWVMKNAGLVLGIVEILVVAVTDILVQVAKAILGIVNIVQPTRGGDKLVAFAEKLEGISAWIEAKFTDAKKALYTFGIAK